MPTDSTDLRASNSIICGNEALGIKVGSDGKLYPISLSFTDLIFPIEVLTPEIIASVPSALLIVLIPGRA